MRQQQLRRRAAAARGLPEDEQPRRVAPEGGDVGVRPPQRELLVQEGAVHVAALDERLRAEPGEGCQPVVDGHDHGVGLRRQPVARVEARVSDVVAAALHSALA